MADTCASQAHEGILFRNRTDAGQRLAEALPAYRAQNAIVLGLPRGGIPVSVEVARGLDLPLDVIVSRKLGAPGNPEFAIGAVAETDGVQLDMETVFYLGIPREYIKREQERQEAEIGRRVAEYRNGKPLPSLEGKAVVLVDDGLATGLTMLAAVHAVRMAKAGRVIVAVPVGSVEAVGRLRRAADEVVCLHTPEPLFGVGMYYEDFSQVSDVEVRLTLEYFRSSHPVTG